MKKKNNPGKEKDTGFTRGESAIRVDNRRVENRTGVEERERDLGLRELQGDHSIVVEQRERHFY